MYIVKIDKVGRRDRNAGGKAANLGELIKAGLPVPDAFVITTEAYELFLKANKIGPKIAKLLDGLDVEDTPRLKEVSGDIYSLIVNSKMPDTIMKDIRDAYEELSVGKEARQVGGVALDMIKAGRGHIFVAVRSSATAEDLSTASFAGQMTTLLNVQGISSLLAAVKECWASLFTPRAIFYRHQQNASELPLIAVIVQRMINSEKAGVIFTADPSTNDKSRIVIESSWGLGESVVSGLVTPDEYMLEKSDGAVLEKRVRKKLWQKVRDEMTGRTVKESVPRDRMEKETLNNTELHKIWELAKKVEDYYNGQPQDIEWCIERGRVFFVQTRPITTLDRSIDTAGHEGGGRIVAEGRGASPGVAHGRARIIMNLDDVSRLERGDVLVTKMTSPDMVPTMRRAGAIVTDEGGLTSHAAIVSRELRIPCIVGTGTATSALKDGEEITVDAVHGKVYTGEGIGETGNISMEGSMEIAPDSEEAVAGEGATLGALGAGLDERLTATEVKVNIAFPETAEGVAERADGVGLLRAEHMLTESQKHPVYLAMTSPDELVRIIETSVGRIARAFHPKPVWYRTLDARTDEFKNLEGGENEPTEHNPMLGWHGVRRSIEQPHVLQCELRALKRLHEQGLDNVAVMLPFIINTEELRSIRQMIDFPIKTGIMVETPAAAMKIEEFCKEGIAFASIGSNDLTQLTLGIDRDNAKISKLYREDDPAVMELIKHTIRICKQYNVESSICGEAGSNPKIAERLVEFGIDSISANIDALDRIRLHVAKTERRLILDNLRKG